MCKYEVGDKIKIIDAGHGVLGCNGCEGIVTLKMNKNGLFQKEPGFNVELTKIKDGVKEEDFGTGVGTIWRVSLKGKYKLISEE